jgi:hypothetical protein
MTAPPSTLPKKRVHPVDEMLPLPKLATYGFPLVICARETSHFDRVLRNGWLRMDNSPGAERAFALIEIAKIANYRFEDLVADANPIAAARFGRLDELA